MSIEETGRIGHTMLRNDREIATCRAKSAPRHVKEKGTASHAVPFTLLLTHMSEAHPQLLLTQKFGVGGRQSSNFSFRMLSMVFTRPSSSFTFGCQPSFVRASVMSGLRCVGSSAGSGL